mmetsp:Transcript_13986/g.21044  ORF Transcript_13986/g.21044 Transcript_13986/m.21044 type:complete len:596 (-) Transcript_13986:1474-3261(-)
MSGMSPPPGEAKWNMGSKSNRKTVASRPHRRASSLSLEIPDNIPLLTKTRNVPQNFRRESSHVNITALYGSPSWPIVESVRPKREETVRSALRAVWIALRALFCHLNQEDSTRQRKKSTRILLRDSYDHQSNGRWNIQRKGGYWVSMYLDDWFNTIVHLPFARLIVLLACFYICVVSIFALLYLSFSQKCGMDFSDRLEAYYFSLETMATIGYGTSDYFFGHCWEPLAIINAQVTVSLVIESLYFGIIFHRLTRGRKRTNTVLFSDKAVIRRVGESYYLIFQVCELRRHHLLDSRIRVFAIRHERDVNGLTAYYQAHRLHLKRPSEGAGGMLLMALPQLVVHRLDATSPLVPPTTWMSENGPRHWPGLLNREQQSDRHHRRGSSEDFHVPPPETHLTKRRSTYSPPPPAHTIDHQKNISPKYASNDSTPSEADIFDGGQDIESQSNKKKKRKQCEQQLYDASVGEALGRSEVMSSPEPSPTGENLKQSAPFDESGYLSSGAPFDQEEFLSGDPYTRQADSLKRNMELFFNDREIEIIAIVEGNDEYTSRLIQARHSYKLEDLGFWRTFSPAVGRLPDGSCRIDFSHFHRTVRVRA